MSFSEKFLHNLTTNEHINNRILLGVFVALIILYILIFSYEMFGYGLIDYPESCYIKCKTKECHDFQSQYKGKNYYLDKQNNDQHCPFGFWELTHIILHIFIGYFLNIYYSLGIGISFELHELHVYDCASYFDILYNTLGCVTGAGLRAALC